ncbi:hypothetical protein H4582DRAFT_1996192 [Lactarius indigo]|nr:hypothetical protein H4582DRAFT_1996192 [Lactarius indigo]
MSRWSCSGRLEKAKEIPGAVPKQRLVRAQGGRHCRGHGAEILQRIPERSRVAVGLSKNIGKWRDGDNGYAPILLSTNMSRLSFTSNLHLDLLAAAPVVSCGSSTSSTMPALLVTLHKCGCGALSRCRSRQRLVPIQRAVCRAWWQTHCNFVPWAARRRLGGTNR